MDLNTLSGAPVSALVFGTMQWGGKTDAAEAHRMYASFRAAGVNHLDTAHVYTGGQSEEITGQMIANERDNVFIATKAGYTGGSGKTNLTAQFEVSRSRLKLDQIDLLYLHRWDAETDLQETLETLAEFQTNGLLRHIGVSNFAAWQVVKAQSVAAKCGTRIDVIQPMYSLLKRQAEVELLPMAHSEDLAVCAYSPLGAGYLTGKYAHGGAGRLSEDARYRARYGSDWMEHASVDFVEYARRAGVDPVTLAVSWVLSHPSRPMPIFSGRNLEQIEPALAARELTPEVYAQVSALSPTPPPATDRLEEAV